MKLFGYVTIRRLSKRFENHVDQYQFYPDGHIPYLDNVDECYQVYTKPNPLTPEELWKSDDLMSLNSELGMSIQDIVRFTRIIEKLHGI